MELKLLVEAPSRARIDVQVELESDTPLQALVDALADYLELPPAAARSALVERSGVRLGGAMSVREAGLRDGDRLTLGDGTPTAVPAGNGVPPLFDLVVLAGPGTGTRRGLAPGRHVIGRGPGADVVLSDRSMSRRHFAADVIDTGVTVVDLGSSNGTFVEGVPLAGEHRIMEGEALEVGRSLIAFEPHAPPTTGRADAAGEIAFNRPPRVARAAGDERLELDAPPAEAPPGARLPLAAAAAPLALGVGMFAATGRAYMLLVALAAPALAIWSHFSTRRAGGTARRAAVAGWRRELEEVAAIAAAARARELDERRAAAPGAAELRERAGALTPELWERRPTDPDFLALRVGVADLPAHTTVTFAPGGDETLRDEALERLDQGAPLRNLPAIVPLAGGAAGLSGPMGTVDALGRWLIAQASVLHSPRELALAAAVDPRRAREWQWLKWLPHAGPDAIATSAPEANELLAQQPAGARLMIVDGELGLSPLAAEEAVARGTHVIWLAKERRDLPGACTAVIELDVDVARARVTDVGTGAVVDDVVADGVTLEWADELARLLAPVRDAGMRTGATVPRRVSLLELLGLQHPTPAAVATRWEQSGEGLPAPIGRTADGPFTIEAAPVEGFRMLLAGMPGAGKSELLQALIAALAVSHPPSRLSFLLVDYKGGAAFRDCLALPHTVGLITDLDARLADRARISLLAELRRREAVLEAAGARSLRELTRRAPADAPPALLIVVDEFAALARELPAFVDTLVDVAQRGRSLGLQLILATQRPRGVVGDALRANMNLRVAMRVSDAAESIDVIDAPSAAAIPAAVPGRAVALTGRAADGSPELTTFQAAFAGGRTSGLSGGRVRIRRLGEDAPDGELQRVLSSVGGSRPTDLQALVACSELAAERLELPSPRPPWMPPLGALVELDDLAVVTPPRVALGVVDDPEAQAQPTFALDLERDGGLLVFGTGGSGRSAALRTLACSLAAATGPDSAQIYALDFGSGGLSGLDALPHVGAVIAADDEERVQRLLGALLRALEARRDLAARGERPGGPGFARVLLLLDGYGAFASAFERVRMGEAVQAVTRLAAEGRALGIHVAVTADRRADVPGALSGVLGTRLVLRMAGEDEYTALGVPRALAAGAALPPGRGFAGAREVQIAWVDPSSLAEHAAAAAAAHPGLEAPPVARMPVRLALERLPAPVRALQAIIGVDGELVAPVGIELADDHFLVAGPRRSGLSNALGTIARSLAAGPSPPQLHLLAPRNSPLVDWSGWASIARGADECAAAADQLAHAATPTVVVLDDGMELGDGIAAGAVEALLRAARDQPIRLVTAIEVAAAQRAYGGWVRELRTQRHGLLLQPSTEDGDLLGVRLSALGVRLPAGRGFLVDHGTARLVQVALSEAASA